MKRVFYILIPVALMTVVALRLKSNKATTQAKIYQYDKQQPVNVQADTLKPMDVDSDYFYTGTFDPDKESRISAEVQGKVYAIYVDAGSVVKKGQALLQLDNSLLKLQLQAVEVKIEGLQADVDRYTVLTQADAVQGVQLEKMQLGLKTAQVERSTLLEQINKTTIRAPFSGIITAKLTELGAFAAPGVPLLQITDLTELKFTINVPESELITFNASAAAKIVADVYPDQHFSGRVKMIGSKGNVANSFPVQFSITNTPDLKIKAGMFGKLTLQKTGTKKEIVISASDIAGSAVRPQVYLIRNGKAVLHDINVSRQFGNKAIVSTGLQEGDVIVTGGFINLFDGANVTVKN